MCEAGGGTAEVDSSGLRGRSVPISAVKRQKREANPVAPGKSPFEARARVREARRGVVIVVR